MKSSRRDNKKRNRFSFVFPILTIFGIGIATVFSSVYDKKKSYNWDGIRKEIKDSINVAEFRGITGGVGGMGVSTMNEVKRRKWIMRNATESELLKLIEYPNGTVKAIVYEGLLRKKEFSKRTELTLRAIKDTIYLVNYQSGCLGWDREIGEYLVRDVLMIDDQSPPFRTGIRTEFGLTELDKDEILIEFGKRQNKKF